MMTRLLSITCLVLSLSLGGNLARAQQPDFYLGETRLFGFGWCPAGWVLASGEPLSIQQYPELFALFGTRFGGGGQYFELPDLRDAVPPTMSWCVAVTSSSPSRN